MQDKKFPGRMSTSILSLHLYLIYNHPEKNGFLFQGAHITLGLTLCRGVTGAFYMNNHHNQPHWRTNQRCALQGEKLLHHTVNYCFPKWCPGHWLLFIKCRRHRRSNMVDYCDSSTLAWEIWVLVPILPLTHCMAWKTFPSLGLTFPIFKIRSLV